jgi:hypothetical protein
VQRPYTGTFDVAGTTPGAQGSQWSTALQIQNLAEQEQNIRVSFIPLSGTDIMTTTISLPSKASWWADEAETLFPQLQNGQIGSLRVDSAGPLAGWARLYNHGGEGTYGQYVPLRSTSPSANASGRLRSNAAVPLPGPVNQKQMFPILQTTAVRTNLGLVETRGRTAHAIVTFYDARGSLAATLERTLQPFESILLPSFADELGLAGGPYRAVVNDTAGEGAVDGYVSVIQASTNDAIMIPAE